MPYAYARYEDIDKEQLEIDIDKIKERIGTPTQEDFQHLLKLERWGRAATFSGYFLIFLVSLVEITSGINSFLIWTLAIVAAVLIGVGNVSRWANVTHPILHGGYDKVPDIPENYTKSVFSKGSRRYIDWLDWLKPAAWEYEHNIMHHYHLNEADDPDQVERNLQWLIQSKVPMWLRYIIIYAFAGTWKFTYYAPNTLKILENKKRRKHKEPEVNHQEWNPKTKNGLELWMNYLLPYTLIKFLAIPMLFLPLGTEAVFNAFIIVVMAEYVANLHSFLVSSDSILFENILFKAY